MSIFNCLRCGLCCKHVDQDYSERRYIPIFFDEINKLRALAEEMEVEIEILPDLTYPDKLNNVFIITSYVLTFGESCGFFDEKKGCLIYEERPLTCKSFPIMVWREDGHRKLLKVETSCFFVKKNLNETLAKNFNELKNFFPQEYKIAEEILAKGKEILYKIVRLEKEKQIDLGYLDGTINLFYDINQANIEHPDWGKIDINLIEID